MFIGIVYEHCSSKLFTSTIYWHCSQLSLCLIGAMGNPESGCFMLIFFSLSLLLVREVQPSELLYVDIFLPVSLGEGSATLKVALLLVVLCACLCKCFGI